MEEIEIRACSSLGGVKKVILVFCKDITEYSIIDGAANIVASKSYEVAYRSQTASLQENTKRSRDGISYKQKVSFSISKDRLGLRNFLAEHREQDLIAITKDANGAWRVVGSLEYPALLDYSFNTQKTASGTNEYDFEIIAEASEPALFLGNLLANQTIFDETFDETFE